MKNKNIKRLDEISRRGFLAGLASMAAQGIVPKSVVGILNKELSTPAGAAGRLSIPAGLALFQVIKDQLYQYDAEDDDDYYEAWSEMAQNLGLDDDDDEYGGTNFEALMDLYHRDPKAAAEKLVQHLATEKINPNTIKVTPRDDWRYEKRIKAGERLIRGQDGNLDWVGPKDSGYPAKDVAGQAAKTAATTVARTQAAPAVAASMTAFKDLVQRVMSAGQTQQPVTRDMGRIQPQTIAPALPAPDRSAADIMAQLRDVVGRDLSSQEQAVVQQELLKKRT